MKTKKQTKCDELVNWLLNSGNKYFYTSDIVDYGYKSFYISAERRCRQFAELGLYIQRFTTPELFLAGYTGRQGIYYRLGQKTKALAEIKAIYGGKKK